MFRLLRQILPLQCGTSASESRGENRRGGAGAKCCGNSWLISGLLKDITFGLPSGDLASGLL